jgi:threonine/homoserine/homoserine lactone efflux protein
MPTTQNITGFLLLSMVIILVPGPGVLFAIGRALVLGTRAALISVFGNAIGVGSQILIVALGLGVLIQQSPDLFFVIKVVGALMIGYLGLKAIWQRKKVDVGNASVSPSGKKVLSESIVVGITNAKTLVFFIAALPSFVDPSGGNPSAQMLTLGALFLIIGVTSDSMYAIAAGKARHWLGGSEKRLANFRGIGGLALMFLGLYMLLDALL